MAIERNAVKSEDKWNVEAMYPSFSDWEKEFKEWERTGQSPKFPEIATWKGRLAETPEALAAFLKAYFEAERKLSKLYTYAHLRHDEDVAQDLHKQAFVRAAALLHDFRQEISWVEPEILQMPEEKLAVFMTDKSLLHYKIHLEKIVRMKPHTLSADKEELVAMAGKALDTAHKAFSSFNNADLKFPNIEDGEGKQRELTHGMYLFYLRQKDRALRKNAFEAVHRSYLAHENTLCELINGQVQGHLFEKQARHYNSCLEAALFPHQIDPKVYTSLIETVRRNLKVLHRYVGIRKKILGYNDLHLYDLHVPLVSEVDFSMPYEKAEGLVVDSVAILGKEYQEDLRKGLTEGRWVDRYENARKRSGAYSSGCYDSMPYILMNYQGTLNDALTLSHEAGHSMHSFSSNHHQPYHYASYPIFVAEVASTFHEELLLGTLLSQVKDKKERCYLINQKIEDIRSTFFRQTMFAEFELRLHQWAEEGVPLTPALLKEAYRKLNADYFGPELIVDEAIDIEWARIPHFYYNFYVYQYATGISAAHALVEKVRNEGEEARGRYLAFLRSGSSKYSLDLLSLAGVDMREPHAVESTIRHFDALVTELETLL